MPGEIGRFEEGDGELLFTTEHTEHTEGVDD
jgi:hypothetical protein